MKVLVVGEHYCQGAPVAHYLRRSGYDTEAFETGADALSQHRRADLLLLDIELPDIDGLAVCREIRANSDIPIITVAETGDELPRILGLQAGSDDCLVKPYGHRELMARIEAVTRRVRARPAQSQAITHGALHVDPLGREVRVGERRIRLTRKEFDLLYVLATNRGAVVLRSEIMAQVWGHTWASSRTLDMHISTLRKKLGARSWVDTVRGVGFTLGRSHSPNRRHRAADEQAHSRPTLSSARCRLVDMAETLRVLRRNIRQRPDFLGQLYEVARLSVHVQPEHDDVAITLQVPADQLELIVSGAGPAAVAPPSPPAS